MNSNDPLDYYYILTPSGRKLYYSIVGHYAGKTIPKREIPSNIIDKIPERFREPDYDDLISKINKYKEKIKELQSKIGEFEKKYA